MKRQRLPTHLPPSQQQLAGEPRHQSVPLPQPPTFMRQDDNFLWAPQQQAGEQTGSDLLAASLVGQAVQGFVESWTDGGFVVAVQAGGRTLRGGRLSMSRHKIHIGLRQSSGCVLPDG